MSSLTCEGLQAENKILQQRVAELEAALAQSQQEQRLHIMLDTTTDWAWEVDASGVYTYISPNIATILGYTPCDIVGKTPFDLMPPEEAERVIAIFGSLAADQQPIPLLENVIIHRDGHRLIMETSGTPFYDQNGSFCGYRGIDRDITQRKQATIEHDQLFTLTPDLICIAGFDGYFKRLNPSWSRVLGWSDDELYARPFLDFVHPDDLQSTIDAAQTLSAEQPVIAFTNRYQCKNGSYRWIEWVSTSVAEQQRIYAVARDITERKQQQEALQETRQFLQLVIDNIPQAIFWKDRALTYLGCNRYFAEAAGLASPQDIIGTDDFAMPWIEHAEQYRADDTQVMVTDTPVYNFEEPFTNAAGSQNWLRTSKIPLHNANGEVFAVLGLFEDITAYKQAEAERLALKQQVIDTQQLAIQQLSAPLLPIADHIVALPLIGSIDTRRTQQIMQILLEGIVQYQATTAIVDITGVQMVDTQVAQALIQTARAVKLLGAQVILTGIQPQIAQTLVHLGIDLHGIVTRSTLQAGIAYAIDLG